MGFFSAAAENKVLIWSLD